MKNKFLYAIIAIAAYILISANAAYALDVSSGKPMRLPPITQPKVSGIDWNATNKLRYYSGWSSHYNGTNKKLFDSYLLDVVNKKLTSEKAISLIKPMQWREQWLYKSNGDPGAVTYKVAYCDIKRIDIKYNNTTKDPQYMLSSAAHKIGGDYLQVVAYYNAKTKTYTLYFLGVYFSYSDPEIKPNQHPVSESDKKKLTMLSGTLYQQLAPETKTNLHWVMFKDDSGKIYIVNGLGNYEGDSSELCMNQRVKIGGIVEKYKDWPGQILDVKTLRLENPIVEETLTGVLFQEKVGAMLYINRLKQDITGKVFTIYQSSGFSFDSMQYFNKKVTVTGKLNRPGSDEYNIDSIKISE